MSIQFYLFTCCVGGSLGGAFFRWYYPNIFKSVTKRECYTALNLFPTLIVGALIGIGVAVFFNSDIAHFKEVYTAYIEKLGLVSCVFTMSVIDKLDEQLLSKISKQLNNT
jgi:hypothetical protein